MTTRAITVTTAKVGVALLVVSGMFLCTFAQAAEVHTVSWLIWHKKEARTTAVRCNDNPGMAMSDPECINVFTAERKVGALASMRVFESNLRKTQDGRDMMGKNNTWEATFWNHDPVARAGVIGECDHPGQGYDDPGPEECAAARQSAQQAPADLN